MDSSLKYLFYFFIFSIGAISISSCENSIKEVNELTNEAELPSSIYKDYDMLYSDSAVLRVKLQGKLMERYEKDSTRDVFKEGVHLWFYNKAKQVQSEMTANHAIRYTQSQIMVATGNVVLYNIKGDKLNTEYLIWDSKRDSVYTDHQIRITTEDDVIMGEGIVTNSSFFPYDIKNPKNSKFKISDE